MDGPPPPPPAPPSQARTAVSQILKSIVDRVVSSGSKFALDGGPTAKSLSAEDRVMKNAEIESRMLKDSGKNLQEAMEVGRSRRRSGASKTVRSLSESFTGERPRPAPGAGVTEGNLYTRSKNRADEKKERARLRNLGRKVDSPNEKQPMYKT